MKHGTPLGEFLVDDCHDAIQLSGLLDIENEQSGFPAEATDLSVQVNSVLGTLSPNG